MPSEYPLDRLPVPNEPAIHLRPGVDGVVAEVNHGAESAPEQRVSCHLSIPLRISYHQRREPEPPLRLFLLDPRDIAV